jgi:hypothetical protein
MTTAPVGCLDEREAFEAFMSHSRRNKGLKKAEQLLNKFEDGTYINEHVQRHWWTWQQARKTASAPAQVRNVAVEVCFDCDIADCHHIRARRAMLAAAPHQAQEAQGDRHGE